MDRLEKGKKGLGSIPRKGTFLVRVMMLWLAVGVAGCSGEFPGKPKTTGTARKAPVPVVVGAVARKTVPIILTAIGNVQAYSTVEVRARVGGELMAVHFREGQEMKKGDLLFTVDPRPYEVQLKQAEANLARNKAQLQNARKQVERYSSVVKKGYVAEELYDQVLANAAALEASVRADEATVESVRLDHKYCTIRSPIDGVVGELKVNQGNLVKANDNEKPMVIIRQMSPIYVSFAIPERGLPDLKRFMADRKLEVEAIIPGAEAHPVRGELSFMENAVDTSTGTIQLKGIFANENKLLWPGQFVNVRLTLTSEPDALVVPSQAVQTGQEGPYVYVVKSDQTVEYRVVTVSRAFDGETIIEKGLAPGEEVVIDGQLRLAPGLTVKIVSRGGESDSSS